MNENFSTVHLVYDLIMLSSFSIKPSPWLPLFELEIHPTLPNLGSGTRPTNWCVQKASIHHCLGVNKMNRLDSRPMVVAKLISLIFLHFFALLL